MTNIKKILIFLLFCLFSFNLVRAETVIATTKITYADTILAKVVSEIFGYPQILLERDKLSNETIAILKELNVSEVIIIGGPAVVSPKVEEELKNLGYEVIRIWGVERFETSALVAKYFWDSSEEAVLLTEDLANERASFRILNWVREAVDFAVDKKIPILITMVGNLEKNVIDSMLSLGVKKVYIFTLSKNLTNIFNELEELNITYELFKVPSPKNCSVIRIGVPEDELWNLSQEVLIYKRCVEIVPVKRNISIEELERLNISILITNLEDSEKFRRNLFIREMVKAEIKNRNRLSSILREKIYDLLADIISRSNETPEDIKKCYLNISSKISEDDYPLLLNCLSKINEYRWKSGIFVQDFVKQKIKDLKMKIVSNYEQIMLKMNLSEEERISEDGIGRWMPDPLEIRDKLRNRIVNRIISRNKEGKLCIQLITCACSPFGRCSEFPTPCDIPPFWKTVSCENINITSGKSEVFPPKK
ncbi:MAG: hypothetical protein QW038_00055 [Nanopusillaceae archaeon]